MPILPAILGGASLLGKLFSGGGKGQADERNNQNQFTLNRNNQELSRYGTQQNALLSALLGQSNEATNRYNTQQGATTNALGQQSNEATSRYNTRQGATQTALGQQSNEGLQRAQLGLQAPSVRARQSLMGSLMQNMQPVSIAENPRQAGRAPRISGGLTPAAIDPMTRQQGGALMQQALEAQLTGSDVPKATNFMAGVLDSPEATDFKSGILQAPAASDFSKAILAAPELGGYKQPGKGETGMSLAGLIGNLLSEIPMSGSGGVILNNKTPVQYSGRDATNTPVGWKLPSGVLNPVDEWEALG